MYIKWVSVCPLLCYLGSIIYCLHYHVSAPGWHMDNQDRASKLQEYELFFYWHFQKKTLRNMAIRVLRQAVQFVAPPPPPHTHTPTQPWKGKR